MSQEGDFNSTGGLTSIYHSRCGEPDLKGSNAKWSMESWTKHVACLGPVVETLPRNFGKRLRTAHTIVEVAYTIQTLLRLCIIAVENTKYVSGGWRSGVAMHACHPSSQETDTGRSRIIGQLCTISKTLITNKMELSCRRAVSALPFLGFSQSCFP